MVMNPEEKDPLLSTPQEANTEKHINFTEVDEKDNTGETNNGSDDEESPTKKAWEELREENKNDKK